MAICLYCGSGKQYESNCSQCGAPTPEGPEMERFRPLSEYNDQAHPITYISSTNYPYDYIGENYDYDPFLRRTQK
jgi:hypothetical protein